jgi:hypothetical protein
MGQVRSVKSGNKSGTRIFEQTFVTSHFGPNPTGSTRKNAPTNLLSRNKRKAQVLQNWPT